MCSFAVFVLLFSYVSSVTVHKQTHNIVADSSEQLPPIVVPCFLDDIVILSAPIVTDNVTSIQLASPNGDTRNLNLSLSTSNAEIESSEFYIKVSINNKRRVISTHTTNKIFNLNRKGSTRDGPTFEAFAGKMTPNQFLIGPLGVEDHGKWLLRIMADENGKWFEMTQVINIEIRELLLRKNPMENLHSGDTFRFGFIHSIPGLKSCKFSAPKATLWQWFHVDPINTQCMLVFENITKEYEGLWKLAAIGRIISETECLLKTSMEKFQGTLSNYCQADTKEQLSPLRVVCSLNDVIVLSAPVVNHNVTTFQLTSPTGVTTPLDLKLTKEALEPDSHENSLVIKYSRRKHQKHRVISLLNNYKLFNINTGQQRGYRNTIFDDHVERMRPNDFMIGPVSEDDHGNWVLSLFAEENGNLLEMFKVISIEIREAIAPKEPSKTLKTGETFRFGFAYPIKDLESCQFRAPKTTYDRWYDRDQDNLDSCMFVVTNVTKHDEGLWMVIGVGKIVYITMSFLNVH